jgi:hypothetical protein
VAIAALLTPLGIRPEDFLDIEEDGYLAALAAAKVFQSLRGTHRALDRALMEREETARGQFEHALAREEDALQGNAGWKLQTLRAAIDEIDQSWPVVMLLPRGPYEEAIQSVVDTLEPDAASGTLRREDQVLFAMAQALANDLAISPRRSANDWMLLEVLFHKLPRVPSQQVAGGDAKRTLN